MAILSVINIYILVFVVSIYGQQNPFVIPDRDQWYNLARYYTDLPRYFNIGNCCPAKQFYLDCNRCVCTPDENIPACTKVLCPKIPQIVNWKSGKPCPAGKPFYWKCNSCQCYTNGYEADCTKKACLDLNQTPK